MGTTHTTSSSVGSDRTNLFAAECARDVGSLAGRMRQSWICVVSLSIVCASLLSSAQSGAAGTSGENPPAQGTQVPSAQQSSTTTPPQGNGQATPANTGDPAKQLQVFVYPAKGQSPQQQQSEEQQCFQWAQSAAANQPPTETAQDSSSQKKGAPVAGGTAKGAAAGAAIGAIAGDAGQGAAIGATGGAMAGAHKRRQAKKQAKKEEQEQQAAKQQQGTDALRRAFAACMEPKGYSVK